jgi:NhaA family Na+:H+ antiporter
MNTPQIKPTIVDRYVVKPISEFMNNSKMSGIILFCSATLAMILSNSPLAEAFHHIWEHQFSIGYDEFIITKDLHHWINDGLMAIFFFVVGLELKREIVAGQLKNPKNAIMPIVAALGGMLFPAIIFLYLNPSGEPSNGWGIPMATDIAFALGILYLLGDRVPVSLKVFLTAIAIVDDLGAVLVIAIFYTSQINTESLAIGGLFFGVMLIANRIGVRNTVFYGIMGIGGVWLAFLLSGVHATIAAVLAAFAIPATTNIDEKIYSFRLADLYDRFNKAKSSSDIALISHEQQEVLEEIRSLSTNAIPPLQRLEHALHPLVAFVVMPIFALSNAGVTLSGDITEAMLSPVTLGVVFGLILGKIFGIFGTSFILSRMRIAPLPEGMKYKQLFGVSLLGAIGFTMSLFIASLAFEDAELLLEAKLGILTASLIASIIGYFVVQRSLTNK